MIEDTLPFLTHVLESFPNRTTARFIVGIVGPPASGKSTLTNQLVDQLNAAHGSEIATHLRMDAYHRTNLDLAERGTTLWKGCHFTFDADAYIAKLRKVSSCNDDCLCPIYDRTQKPDPIPDAHVIRKTHQIVVTEGNYLLAQIEPWCQIKDLLDYTIFIEVDEDIQKQRLVTRHQQSGRTPAEALAKTQSTDLPNSTFIRQSLEGIDFMFRPKANFA